ncbi:peroxisomal membrane protein pex14 [Geranomyces michiganensis]|nr:peroxisomal membrane protein pex14 [Geranomyces michiganensis]
MVKPGVREDIVASAVRFLSDPKVQESPLAKRVAFLESKGLSADEIEEAMSRTNGGTAVAASAVSQVATPVQYAPQQYPAYAPPPPPAAYTWKDYTLGAVGAVGAGYGVYSLVKKYLLPALSLPTASSLDASTQQISAQLTSTTAVLDAVRAETGDVMKALDAQAANVNDALKGMVDTLALLRENDEQRDDEMLSLRRDIDGIKTLIPQMLDKSKEAQTAVISDLQAEIKSLKSLLLNRRIPISAAPSAASLPPSGETSATSTPPTASGAYPALPTSGSSTPAAGGASNSRTGSIANIPTKPAIPAWQLASQQQQQQQQKAASELGQENAAATPGDDAVAESGASDA